MTANYWLGLTPLATEQWGSEPGRNSAVYRPDAETTSNPVSTGYWGPRTINSANGHMEYSTDSVRGKVGHIYATDTSRACFMLGDRAEDDWNSTASSTPFADSSHRHVGLWMKFTGPGSDSFYVVLTLRSIDGSSTTHEHYMVYQTIAGSPYIQNGNEDRHPIGESWEDGSWHYFERDLEKDLKDLFPSETVTYVDSIYFIANNLYVDDIVFSGGVLKRSYAVVPGSVISGPLGSWTGPNVTKENGNAIRYFQYGDLGAVMTQTKSDSSVEGAWEPDSFGEYDNRYASTASPTTPELGKNGQPFDKASGAYLLYHRWLDPERGRWLTPDPIGIAGGQNLYSNCVNDPINYTDPFGLDPWWHYLNPWYSYNRAMDYFKNKARPIETAGERKAAQHIDPTAPIHPAMDINKQKEKNDPHNPSDLQLDKIYPNRVTSDNLTSGTLQKAGDLAIDKLGSSLTDGLFGKSELLKDLNNLLSTCQEAYEHYKTGDGKGDGKK